MKTEETIKARKTVSNYIQKIEDFKKDFRNNRVVLNYNNIDNAIVLKDNIEYNSFREPLASLKASKQYKALNKLNDFIQYKKDNIKSICNEALNAIPTEYIKDLALGNLMIEFDPAEWQELFTDYIKAVDDECTTELTNEMIIYVLKTLIETLTDTRVEIYQQDNKLRLVVFLTTCLQEDAIKEMEYRKENNLVEENSFNNFIIKKNIFAKNLLESIFE